MQGWGCVVGRSAKYSDQHILDAALAVVAAEGPGGASVVAIAKHLGAPSGSVYHRFASRDLILATLWTRTVRRFQEGFLAALDNPAPLAAARAAVAHVLTWSAAHAAEAKLLTLYRREDLIALWPEELGEDLATLNDGVKRAVIAFAAAHFGSVDNSTLGRAQFALIDIPYAAARRIIDSGDRAPRLEEAVVAASLAALGATGTES